MNSRLRRSRVQFSKFQLQITTLGKLFTHMCLCWYQSKGNDALLCEFVSKIAYNIVKKCSIYIASMACGDCQLLRYFMCCKAVDGTFKKLHTMVLIL